MATPSKRTALTALRTALQGITVAGGYKTTVKTVSLTVMDWETARQDGEFPWIGIKPGRNDGEHFGFDHIRSTMTVQLACHLDAATDTAAYDALEDLLDDIIVATMTEPTLGGSVIDIKYMADETDEGDPDKMDSHGGSGSMVIELKIIFQRTTSAS